MIAIVPRRLIPFAAREDGASILMALFMIVAGLVVGGFAVDYGNAQMQATLLQNTADSTAHTALVVRELHSPTVAMQAALVTAEGNMPPSLYGAVVKPEDIVFGTWNQSSFTFTPDANAKTAVMVTAHRSDSYLNAIPTFLFRLVGINTMNEQRTAIYTTYYPNCLREGFVASGVVDLQSNNEYTNGFCIHSNSYVSLNSGNLFDPGTVVSMPDLANLDLPSSGFDSNQGLQQALRQGSWDIRILDQLPGIISGLANIDPLYTPSYILATSVQPLTNNRIAQTDLTPGQVYTASCSGGNALTFTQNVVVSGIVLVTNCSIKFDQGVVLQDSVIATTSTSANSITSPSGLQVGRNDNCASGGGAQILTLGGMNFPSDLQIYGSQLIASGDVDFSANANGIQGASIIAGGQISGTSNMVFGFCGSGMENNFQAEYFRLAM